SAGAAASTDGSGTGGPGGGGTGGDTTQAAPSSNVSSSTVVRVVPLIADVVRPGRTSGPAPPRPTILIAPARAGPGPAHRGRESPRPLTDTGKFRPLRRRSTAAPPVAPAVAPHRTSPRAAA